MTAVFPMFDIPTIHKRKRTFEDVDDDNVSQLQSKRRIPTVLPFRSPPQARPSISITPPVSSYFHRAAETGRLPYSAPAADCSDNSFPPADQVWHLSDTFSHSPVSLHQGTQSMPHSPLTRLDNHDYNPSCPPMVRSHSGRARSNDLISPQRLGLPDLLSLPNQTQHFEQSRIPTPISTTFDHRLMDLSKPTKQMFPPARSHLSPMMEQESWMQQRSTSTHDLDRVDSEDTVMMADEHILCDRDTDPNAEVDSMDAEFSISPRHAHGEQHHQLQRFGHERQRSARLHMGFLSGCEKCTQKIPGHYSHILWS